MNVEFLVKFYLKPIKRKLYIFFGNQTIESWKLQIYLSRFSHFFLISVQLDFTFFDQNTNGNTISQQKWKRFRQSQK